MPELSGTIKFEVAGPLNLADVSREINRLSDERIPKAAKITTLRCRVDDSGVTKCSLKWTLESAPFVGAAVR